MLCLNKSRRDDRKGTVLPNTGVKLYIGFFLFDEGEAQLFGRALSLQYGKKRPFLKERWLCDLREYLALRFKRVFGSAI